MKKLILFMAICFATSTARSQVYIQGGLNLANISTTSSGATEDNNMLISFNAGILGRFDISRTIDLESGILLTGKGSKAETYFSGSRTDNYVKTEFNPLYLEIPLNVVLRLPLQGRKGFFFHAGPSMAIGIGGKSKTESSILGLKSTGEADIKFSNDDPFTSGQDDAAYNKLKRFDFALNVGGGIDFGRVMLKANYGLGLSKINSTESNNSADDKNKYRTLSLSVGIPLNR